MSGIEYLKMFLAAFVLVVIFCNIYLIFTRTLRDDHLRLLNENKELRAWRERERDRRFSAEEALDHWKGLAGVYKRIAGIVDRKDYIVEKTRCENCYFWYPRFFIVNDDSCGVCKGRSEVTSGTQYTSSAFSCNYFKPENTYSKCKPERKCRDCEHHTVGNCSYLNLCTVKDTFSSPTTPDNTCKHWIAKKKNTYSKSDNE